MPNPYVNKVQKSNGEVLIDLSTDTVESAADIIAGKVGHLRDGTQVTGSAVVPIGNINITQAGVTDVTNYATATVPEADAFGEIDIGYTTRSGQRKWDFGAWLQVDEDGWVSNNIIVANTSYDAIPTGTSVTPTESAQTIGGANTMMEGAVTVNAIPSNYVGSGITRRTSSDLTASGATVTAPAGYYSTQATKTVASGSATAPASISGTAATVSTGTNTLTLTKTVSVTPTVTAGYVASGTAGNSSVSLQANVTTKAAATITPGTTNQTIASGTYLTGAQTISGDANLVAENIKNGTSIFGVTGTYTGGGGGASNVVTGTFKGTTTGAAMDVNLAYTGDGYPIGVWIYPINGKSGNSTFSGLVQRYAMSEFFGAKIDATTPTYATSGTQNQFVVQAYYKSSSSSATSYNGVSALNSVTLSGGSASNSATSAVKFKNNKTMSVYIIASTAYGFAANIEYQYAVIYSS